MGEGSGNVNGENNEVLGVNERVDMEMNVQQSNADGGFNDNVVIHEQPPPGVLNGVAGMHEPPPTEVVLNDNVAIHEHPPADGGMIGNAGVADGGVGDRLERPARRRKSNRLIAKFKVHLPFFYDNVCLKYDLQNLN